MTKGLFARQVKILLKKDYWALKSHKKSVCAEIVIPILIAIIAGELISVATNPESIYMGGNWYTAGRNGTSPANNYYNYYNNYVQGTSFISSTQQKGSNSSLNETNSSSSANSSDPYNITTGNGTLPLEPGNFEMGSFFYQLAGHGKYEEGWTDWVKSNRSITKQMEEYPYLGHSQSYRIALGINLFDTQQDAQDSYGDFYRKQKALQSWDQQPQAWVINIPNCTTLPMDEGNGLNTTVQFAQMSSKSLVDTLPMFENLYYQHTSTSNTSTSSSHNATTTTTTYHNTAPSRLYDFQATWIQSIPGQNQLQTISTLNALLLQLAFIPLVITTGGRLVDEKRSKMREHLRVMGVRSSAYLLSVYGFGIIRVTLICICMFLAFLAGNSGLSRGYLVLTMLTQGVFGLSLLSFSTLMPCMFSKSIFSAVTSFLFILGFNVGGIFLTDPVVPQFVQWLVAFLFCPSANIMATAQFLGANTTTLPVSPGSAIVFMLMQSVWYALLSQYLYALFPGEYGVSQHWLFPVYMVGRWIKGGDCQTEEGKKQKRKMMNGEISPLASPMLEAEEGEEGQQDQDWSIQLQNLYKYYGSQRDNAAVNGLSLNVKKGEIMALLGHNGAGKTTTISMLTGMLGATNYDTALIDGLDLEKDVDLIRHHISTCPQFDILFEDLSASQHMEIFAALKGAPNERGEELLSRLSLPIDRQKSVTFSGGMKRRLSVACAMVGESPIVFLDEPSSGLDPMSRRELWDIIREERDRGKTIILTTHFMEEADYLGERIAIMSHGRLYCCDTSTALKRRYGVGYYLTVVKSAMLANAGNNGGTIQGVDDDTRTEEMTATTITKEAQFDSEGLLALCQQHCPGTTVSQDSLGDCSFLLPSEHLSHFGTLLTSLEQKLTSLGASSYGIRMNSLEDVFIKISEDESAKGNDGGLHAMSAYDTDHLISGISVEELFAASTTQNQVSRFFSQVSTMFRKKGLFLSRSKRVLFLGIFVPLAVVVLAWATAIPMGDSSNDYSGGISYDSGGTDIPPYDDWVVPYMGTPTPDQQGILDRTAQLALENSHQWPGVTPGQKVKMSFKPFSVYEMELGMDVDTKTISFTGPNTHIPFAIGNVDQASVQSAQAGDDDDDGGYDGYAHSQNASHWGIAFNYRYDPLMGLEAFKCLRQAWLEYDTGHKDPAGLRTDLPIFYSHLAAPELDGITPAPYVNPYEENNQGSYLLIPTGVFAALAVGFYASTVCLQIADELNRHIFHTIRMHGMSALAYWVGTALFDLLVGLLLIAAMVAGPYVRGVQPVQRYEFAIFAALVLLGDVLWTLLSAYAYMCVWPSLKPNTHIAIIVGTTFLSVLVPSLLELIWLTKGSPIPTFVQVMLPPMAVVSAYASVPPSKAGQSSNPFMEPNDVATACLVSVFLWCLPPIAALWYSATSALRDNAGATKKTTPGEDSPLDASSPLLAGKKGGSRLAATVDEDVKAEKERVDAGPQDDMVEGVHLRKIYSGGQVAVRDLTLGVRKGECFGLLGPNGAGKTTAVKMLLKELGTSKGYVHYPYTNIAPTSKSLDSDYQEARLGVCQQHDTLWETFTAEEHLDLYLRIRLGTSYKKADWAAYRRSAIKKVYLDAEGKYSAQFSGGMKRKLAVAIALYSGAKTVFLDEPSTGMDPYARRAMWKSINEALANDRGVVLTTHSMEEADAVCARIAIVTKGVMQCIGSGQHLKNKFGTGFAISLLLKAVEVPEGSTQTQDDAVEAKCQQTDVVMQDLFGQDCLRGEVQATSVQYHLPDLNIAQAFSQLAAHASRMGLESYSVNQVTSLEQIFIGFAAAPSAAATRRAVRQNLTSPSTTRTAAPPVASPDSASATSVLQVKCARLEQDLIERDEEIKKLKAMLEAAQETHKEKESLPTGSSDEI